MKTDDFDDAIRRKLESIEPPFRERDWSHMQTFMHRHGYPAPWAGVSQWLVPLASAAAVTGLIISTLWQFRINHELSQSLQTLSQTVARLETTQAKLIENQKDTVYVTTSTNPVTDRTRQPAVDQPDRNQPATNPAGAGEGYARQSAPSADQRPRAGEATPRESPADRTVLVLPAPTSQRAQRPTLTRSTDNRPASVVSRSDVPPTDPAAGRPDVVNEIRPDRTVFRSDRPTTRLNSNLGNSQSAGSDPLGNDAAAPRLRNDPPAAAPRYAGTKPADGRGAGQRSEISSSSVENETATRPAESISRLATRLPVIDPAPFAEGLAKRTRRIRSIIPATATVLPTSTAPAEVASSRPVGGGVHLRVGAAGEVSTRQQTVGAYAELLVGKHWSVGAGLNQTRLQGGEFADDNQFKRKTKNDFRKMYAPRIDPRHSIVDIDRQFTLWQVPVSVSYRALLGRGFALVPTAGMDITVSAQEQTTFTDRRGPSELDRFPNVRGLPQSPPPALFNNYTVALGAEKVWKRLVFQAGPVLSVPTRALADPVNPVSLSLRTRILFQF